MLPNTSVLGKKYGFKSIDSATDRVNQVKDNDLNIKIDSPAKKSTKKTTLSNMGLKIDGKQTIQPALDYSWQARLIPFSIFLPRSVNDFGVISSDSKKTDQFMASLTEFDVPPVDATLKVKQTVVEVIESKQGKSFSNKAAKSALLKTRISQDMHLNTSGVVDLPIVNTAAAKEAAKKVDARINTAFVVSIDNQAVKVEPKVLGSWMVFASDTSKKTIAVSYDRAKIKAFLDPYGAKLFIDQVPKKVTTLDGVVTGEVQGKSGRQLSTEKSTDAIITAASGGKELASTIVVPVDPKVLTSASYTRSSKGVQALIDAWVKSHSGSFNVSMRDLSGGISASYNSSARVTAASLYKLYVIDVVYTKAAKGELDLASEVMPGKTYETCIDLAIVRSDNPCALAMGDKIGWQANDGFLASQGFGSTTLGRTGGFFTTAKDTMNYLLKLQNGSLVQSNYGSSMLSQMRRQIYRAGIPAGSTGTVANKVGFIDGYNHDAGIVYHPNGTYVLVIMSKGSNFANIADLSRQISNLMSQ